MSCSEWINLGLFLITLLALVTVWILAMGARAREQKDQVDRVKKRGSLYLDVFEIKLEKELHIIDRGGVSATSLKSFECDNQRNYNALEHILQDATVLEPDEYMELKEFVRDYKTAPEMESPDDVNNFLKRIRNENLRKVFPRGRGLKEAIGKINPE